MEERNMTIAMRCNQGAKFHTKVWRRTIGKARAGSLRRI